LENEFSDVKNYSIAVKEDSDNIIFLRKIIPQGADKSYGIYVAKLAKLPDEVINRSREILSDLERNHVYESVSINHDDNIRKNKLNDHNANVVNIDDSSKNRIEALEKELDRLKNDKNDLENKHKNQYEALKMNHAELIKTYNNEKENHEKLYEEYSKLNEKVSNSDEVKEVAVTQISFDNIGGNDLAHEIINLDILNMTPLDAMNALYMLQKKAKK
jgi:DNA mismatch repair protein MutS